MYKKGEGVIQDNTQANVWYHKAEDYTHAFAWFRKAAEKGDSGAIYKLAVMYEKGIGVKKDINKSLEYFCKSGVRKC